MIGNLTPSQFRERLGWNQGFQEGFVVEVTETEVSWGILMDRQKDGRGTDGFGYSKELQKPEVGDFVRLYTEGYSRIRGLDLNGQPVFFWTSDDMKAKDAAYRAEREAQKLEEWRKNKNRLLAEVEALPPIFQKRIEWFVENCPRDFNSTYLAYEVFVCSEAVKIAQALKTEKAVEQWIRKGYRKRKALTEQGLLYESHSGNTMGIAARLAYNYLKDQELVLFEHGALVPLVGCYEYGCAHPRPEYEEWASRQQEVSSD